MAKSAQPEVTLERLMQFGSAYAPPLIIGAAVSNNVFDTLARGPKSIDEVSRNTGASTRGLRAIMNALLGLELLTNAMENMRSRRKARIFSFATNPVRSPVFSA